MSHEDRRDDAAADASQEPDLYRFGVKAMATEFEILFPAGFGHDVAYLSRAASECFSLLSRLEEELSRFRMNSDISRINRLLPGGSTRVGLATVDCLSLAVAVGAETGGAFDVTVGPLMEVYQNRDRDGSPGKPKKKERAAAMARTGSGLFEVDRDQLSVTLRGEGISLDLGGLGKGYALDQMGLALEAWGITAALLNAGDSTVLGLGSPSSEEGERGWPVRADGAGDGELYLCDQALSGSGFLQKGAHIMDPRKGKPVKPKRIRTWALAPTAAMSDALSTAFSVMKKTEVTALCERHEGVRALFWNP